MWMYVWVFPFVSAKCFGTQYLHLSCFHSPWVLLATREWPLSDLPSIDYGVTPIRITVYKSCLITAMMGLDAHRRPVWLSQSLCIWSTHLTRSNSGRHHRLQQLVHGRCHGSTATAWLTRMAACRRCNSICTSASLFSVKSSPSNARTSQSSPVPAASIMAEHNIVATNTLPIDSEVTNTRWRFNTFWVKTSDDIRAVFVLFISIILRYVLFLFLCLYYTAAW